VRQGDARLIHDVAMRCVAMAAMHAVAGKAVQHSSPHAASRRKKRNANCGFC
jgi:hypothetical protein